jgi:hypothetical protein
LTRTNRPFWATYIPTKDFSVSVRKMWSLLRDLAGEEGTGSCCACGAVTGGIVADGFMG